MVQTNYRPFSTALLNPCADPIFKILFTNESDEARQALTSFLCDILERNVTDVVLQPNELSGEAMSDRQSEFDINCKIDGKYANIEMQGESKKSDYGKRAEYHAAHILNHYTPKGTDWDDIPQVFQISVLNFYFDNKTSNSVNHYVLRNEEGRTISSTINVIFLELPKIANLSDDISKLTKAQMWGKFFLYANQSDKEAYIQKLTQVNGGIKMAFTVLKNISQDELNWYHESRYWMHVSDELTMKNAARREGLAEGHAEGHAKGLAEGHAEGLAEGRIEGSNEKAVEAALTIIQKYKATPKEAAKDVGAPLEKVLEALNNSN